MFEKELKRKESKYISCIKLDGMPILPPLLTQAKRKEMYRNKLQAIKLEKRLKRERELRQYIDKYYTPKINDYTDLPITNTLEHQLSFRNETFSHIVDTENQPKKTLSTPPEVPSPIQKRTPSLSCDVQVSQYANNKFTVLADFDKCKWDVATIDTSTVESNVESESENLSKTEDDRPRLIRRNSYTLESPSPMLLNHLRKQKDESIKLTNEGSLVNACVNDVADQTKDDMPQAKITPERNKDNGCEEYDDDLDYSVYSDVDKTDSELRNISTGFSDRISNNDAINLIDNEYHLKAFIDNNVPQISNKQDPKETEGILNGSNVQDRDTNPLSNLQTDTDSSFEQMPGYDESSLEEILKMIPDVYSKQIIELWEKQKQTHNYCVEPNRKSDLGADIGLYKGDQMSAAIDEINKSLHMTCNKTTSKCSRELFPEQDKEVDLEHAACILTAAAKGFLVRRMMQTERVQGLIQTIREALMCAMQLHTENIDTINESDVELHRRLIQQVSAACLEFYDVFFSLNASEKMAIIRCDRERKKEKAKRPLSRVSSGSQPSRSSRSIAK